MAFVYLAPLEKIHINDCLEEPKAIKPVEKASKANETKEERKNKNDWMA